MRTAINVTNQRVHGNITRNILNRAAGNIDARFIQQCGDRAQQVLASTSIYATGSKVNGWGENVEAYELVKANGSFYEVQLHASGEGSCNCPSWKTQRARHAGNCKHVLAIKAIRAA